MQRTAEMWMLGSGENSQEGKPGGGAPGFEVSSLGLWGHSLSGSGYKGLG